MTTENPMTRPYAVDRYRRGTLIGSNTVPTFEEAREQALAHIRQQIASGERIASAYVRRAGGLTVRSYRAWINRAGRVQAQSL